MIKTKILIANDASILGTGYGVYGKELLKRLNATGKYEIAELACYADINTPGIKDYEWKVYPNAVGPQHKDWESYRKTSVSAFGGWRFNKVAIHFQPDIVFDIRDYWMYAYQEVSPFRKFYRWVVMPTVDSAPQKQQWLYTFANMDLIIPYTDWAKKTLQNQCGNNINLFPDIANAGVDLDVFIPAENKKDLQKKIFQQDVSITGLVMRNQKRKLFPDVFAAYRSYLDRLLSEGNTELYNKSYLYLHTSYPEHSGWDFPDLLLEYNLLDKVYFTSYCKNCKAVYPTKFHECISTCSHCGEAALILPNANNAVPTESLAKIYQLFDFFIQAAICEGFGMPQVEAAACGIPIASVDYSAMTEIVQKLEGYPIPVQRLYREMETGADRAYPDINKLTDIIYNYHVNTTEEEKINKSIRTRTLCKQYYSWDTVADVWDRAFDTLDLTQNIPWNSPMRKVDNTKTVPKNLETSEFVKFIVEEIINEPELLHTSPIQNLIKNFSNGYNVSPNNVLPMTVDSVIKHLEEFLNNKKVHEAIRLNPEKLFQEDFLNV